VLEPRLPWELTGQVPNVVFPSGLVLPDHDGDLPVPRSQRCLLYYGAADTCIGLAVCTVGKLIDDCLS
ncbi:MAG: glycosidase, partial [bacterium]|nr:glycosidase [bacterium]